MEASSCCRFPAAVSSPKLLEIGEAEATCGSVKYIWWLYRVRTEETPVVHRVWYVYYCRIII